MDKSALDWRINNSGELRKEELRRRLLTDWTIVVDNIMFIEDEYGQRLTAVWGGDGSGGSQASTHGE